MLSTALVETPNNLVRIVDRESGIRGLQVSFHSIFLIVIYIERALYRVYLAAILRGHAVKALVVLFHLLNLIILLQYQNTRLQYNC